MILVGGFLLAGLFFLMAAKPLATWRVTEGWTYKHPEANAPSELALGLNTVSWVIAGIVTIVGTLILNDDLRGQDECAVAEKVFEQRDNPEELAELEKQHEMKLRVREEKTATTTLTRIEVVQGGRVIGGGVESEFVPARWKCRN